jgi:hypothetical protein
MINGGLFPLYFKMLMLGEINRKDEIDERKRQPDKGEL